MEENKIYPSFFSNSHMTTSFKFKRNRLVFGFFSEFLNYFVNKLKFLASLILKAKIHSSFKKILYMYKTLKA